MKKWFFTLLIIGFTTLSANATTQVFFGNTGRPVSYSHGHISRSINNFGSNAMYSPSYRENHRRYERSFAQPISGRYARPRPDCVYRNNHQNIMNRTNARMARARVQKTYEINTVHRSRTTVSRFSKSYQISNSNSNKIVTCGGVTYYGNTNACK